MGSGFNLNNFTHKISAEMYVQGHLLWPRKSLKHKLL